MIVGISNAILKYLLKSEVIDDEYSDFYRYGIEITISSFLNIILVLLIGCIFGAVVECLVFLVPFVVIRQFTGGFHAPTYFWCNASLCIILMIVLGLNRLVADNLGIYMSIILSSICVLVIMAFSPIEHKNKPIPHERRWFHRMMATIIGSVYGVVGTIMIYYDNSCGAVLIYTLCAVTALIIIAKILDRRCNNEEEQQNSYGS